MSSTNAQYRLYVDYYEGRLRTTLYRLLYVFARLDVAVRNVRLESKNGAMHLLSV